MNSRTILIVALAALTAIPAIPLAMGWGAGSVSEPSTKEDRSPFGQTAMFPYANDGKTAPMKERIYFDGVLLHSLSPLVLNVFAYDSDLDGGRTVSPVENQFMTFLGYWRDCDGDGYIGHHGAPAGASNLAEYPSALLDASGLARCPLGSPYNNGVLVDEFRWIGPGAAPDPNDPTSNDCLGVGSTPIVSGCHADRNDVSDAKARVWSDWGRPSEQFIPNSGIIPVSRGSFQDSEGTLKLVDDDSIGLRPGCTTAVKCTYDQALGAGAWNTKPCIGDQPRCVAPQPAWAPFQVKRLYNDSNHNNERGNDIVMVWDYKQNSNPGQRDGCDSTQLSDPTGTVGTPSLNPRLGDKFASDPTRYGSVDATLADNTRPDFLLIFNDPGGCTADGQHGFYPNLEDDGQASLVGAAKTKVDQTFSFIPDLHNDILVPAGLPANMPNDGGTGQVLPCKDGLACPESDVSGPGWYASVIWSGRPPRAGFGSLQVAYHTFYAEISGQAITGTLVPGTTAATALPGGSVGAHTYGLDNCPNGFGTNVLGAHGWSCDQAAWHATVTDPTAIVVGEKYDLRDVDCYDNRLFSINNVNGPAASIASLGVTDSADRACGN